jgi:hypothetical protein
MVELGPTEPPIVLLMRDRRGGRWTTTDKRGKERPRLAWWMTVAEFFDVRAVEAACVAMTAPGGEVVGYESTVDLRSASHHLVGRATSSCTRDEVVGWDKKAGKPVTREREPDCNLRGMAGSRAAARACALAWGWLPAACGLDTGDDAEEADRRRGGQQPARPRDNAIPRPSPVDAIVEITGFDRAKRLLHVYGKSQPVAVAPGDALADTIEAVMPGRLKIRIEDVRGVATVVRARPTVVEDGAGMTGGDANRP